MTHTPFLSDQLLARIHDRAADYDRENAFFADDLAELREVGYLRALVPTDLGGLGLSLTELAREQSRLAAAAPATALGINMHLVWTGVAKTLHDRGDSSLDFVLTEAAAGEIFAFAISEPGNDLVLFGSTTDARPLADGSVAFTGTKVFTSLSPVWTRLGLFGLDSTSADAPKLVHGFVTRDSPGITVIEDWDTIGMRASQSNTTRLDGAVVAADRVVRRLDPGPSADPLIFAIFANFEILIAAVYAGIGARALELAVSSVQGRTSARTGLTKDKDPNMRWKIAEAAIRLDALQPQIDALAGDVDGLVDRGDLWFRALVGVKSRATRTARFVVEQAVAVAGGAAFSNSSEIGRLYRDVLAGGFHPSSEDSAHSTVATALLGPE
ncbi:acyl-CoA dehydrogenase family protein [Lacisediminihabitans changchengi]|uniref:Acyl-CoA/acyl-ACP dehydrogenase n=1 Tax=Lacisediminihabitans changchengi TaxID=2787634 RepID=A0A934SJ33_9MICO|nr:acyl-CoA dehydrogenase family protein [Lacisediminihabitans changchengi]MBK4347571.1 acyl-CoA/acyl-ACP dehydrogenase [Lacisediminihabitans changchengi]